MSYLFLFIYVTNFAVIIKMSQILPQCFCKIENVAVNIHYKYNCCECAILFLLLSYFFLLLSYFYPSFLNI